MSDQQQRRTTGTATSRAGTVRRASRKPTKARVALSGPSGSGKTWTALSIARVLSPKGRVVFIDSEPSDDRNTAAELYADEFDFDLIDWRNPPFDPRDLALTITELGQAGQTDVLVVDSGSPFWRGEGGTLDIAGGNFSKWTVATPAQNDLVASILRAPMHVIFCMRVKQDFQVEQKSDGKQNVVKLGLAPIQRDDLEYEFQVIATMDMDHRIEIGKTRCQPLAGKSWTAGKQGEFAEILLDWTLKGGDLILQVDADLLVAAFGLIPEAERGNAKKLFAREVGRPDQLENAQLPAAWAWLSAHAEIDPHVYVQGEAPDVCATCRLPERAGWHGSAEASGSDEASGADASPPASGVVDESSTDDPGASETSPGESEGVTGDESSSSPDTDGETGQSDTGEEPPAEEPGIGHCARCGWGAWRDGDVWRHADEEAPGDHDVVPLPEGADADAVLAAWTAAHTPDPAAIRATIEAEVGSMPPAKIVVALKAANLPTNGSPKICKERWLAHRLSTELTSA